MFFQTGFIGMQNSASYPSTNIQNINKIQLQNGVFDELYISKDIEKPYSSDIPQIWDFDTILHANFNGNLFAGNTDFTIETVSDIRIKRRKKGTQSWTTIFSKEIKNREDFKITEKDWYAATKEYEYALVPVMNGVEGNYNINSIDVNFEGLFIVDKQKMYKSILNIDYITPTKQKQSNIVIPIDRKYPFVISSKENNYYSGEITASFFKDALDGYYWDTKNSWEYREELKNWLFNGMPKILKYDDGRMWIISVIGDIADSADGHRENIKTTFEFVETGNPESNKDLFRSGLINSYVEGE